MKNRVRRSCPQPIEQHQRHHGPQAARSVCEHGVALLRLFDVARAPCSSDQTTRARGHRLSASQRRKISKRVHMGGSGKHEGARTIEARRHRARDHQRKPRRRRGGCELAQVGYQGCIRLILPATRSVSGNLRCIRLIHVYQPEIRCISLIKG